MTKLGIYSWHSVARASRQKASLPATGPGHASRPGSASKIRSFRAARASFIRVSYCDWNSKWVLTLNSLLSLTRICIRVVSPSRGRPSMATFCSSVRLGRLANASGSTDGSAMHQNHVRALNHASLTRKRQRITITGRVSSQLLIFRVFLRSFFSLHAGATIASGFLSAFLLFRSQSSF